MIRPLMILGALCFGLLLSGCFSAEDRQAVRNAIHACQGIRLSRESPYQSPETNEFNDVSPACSDALDAVFEIDKISFQLADRPVLNRLYESLQVLMSYPYQLRADGRLFGPSDTTGAAGVVPLGVLCILTPNSDCADSSLLGTQPYRRELWLPEHLFEWVSRRISRFRYLPVSEAGNAYARYTLHNLDVLEGQTTITDEFAPIAGEQVDRLNRNRFTRTSIVVHESTHGAYGSHVVCPDESEGYGPDALVCDTTLSGPYGMEVNYLIGLMRANWGRLDANRQQILTERDGNMIARTVCVTLKKRINLRDVSIVRLVENLDCDAVAWDWLTGLMGLPALTP